MDADHDNGEFWLALKEIEQKNVLIDALYSENMYKSVYHFKQKISPAEFDEKNEACLDICNIILKESSKFMVNIFSCSHEFDVLDIIVRTNGDDKNNIKLDYELPDISWCRGILQKGEPKTQYNQRFQLQPNTYTISVKLETTFENLIDEKLSLFIRIGSIRECEFENSNLKSKKIIKD